MIVIAFGIGGGFAIDRSGFLRHFVCPLGILTRF